MPRPPLAPLASVAPLALSLLLLLLAAAPAAVSADLGAFAPVVADITAQGDAVTARYTPDHGLEAAERFADLYFDVFEGSGMEAAISKADENRKVELEALFSDVIGAAMRAAPRGEVEQRWQALRDGLNAVTTTPEAATDRSGGLFGLFGR